MNLVKYRTNNLFPGMRDMESFFDRFFSNDALFADSRVGGFNPTMNLATEGDQYLVSLELPGVTAEDIELQMDQGVLTITGEKKEEEKKEGKNFHRVECSYGRFTRKIRFPSDVDSEKISASFENGVLKVSVPKAESAKPRKIPVNQG